MRSGILKLGLKYWPLFNFKSKVLRILIFIDLRVFEVTSKPIALS